MLSTLLDFFSAQNGENSPAFAPRIHSHNSTNRNSYSNVIVIPIINSNGNSNRVGWNHVVLQRTAQQQLEHRFAL